ncbi:type II toxin-antitoxin system RelE/ParE family toxin [Candidatus Azambacteria bacterium]|nr:type II toxin-antitoxin system RelE/ParE family toxin [Candidatus Azambacteria bacterium]
MKFSYTNKAAKQLESLEFSIQKRIISKMRFYAIQENPLKFAEHLTDYREGEFRFRIGKYRLTFDARDQELFILNIELRDKVYK